MKCIVCLTDKDLNTHMKVEVDNELYEVHLCDEHAETTTMGQVTKKVKEIKDKLRNAVQLAIDLGISIPEINVPKQDTMPDFDILPPENGGQNIETKPSVEVIPPTSGNAAMDQQPVIRENVIKRDAAPVKLSDSEEINCDTDIEMQEVEVRGGKVAIPKRTMGDAGSTDIKILNTKDDIIQKRFREMKEIGDTGAQVPSGYTGDCLACNGSGTHPVLKKECPRCNGTGMKMS